MKYKYKQNQYKINLQYTDEPPVSYNSNENKLFFKIAANNKTYSAVGDGMHITAGNLQNKLVYYQHIYHGFLLSYIWIKNIISNMKDCLLISNRLYFIEGLLVYGNIKKINIIPTYVDKEYKERYNYRLAQFKEKFNKKIIIEENTIKNSYTNIIIYNSMYYNLKDLNNNKYYYNIYWVANALKHLKKNGNLFFRITNIMENYSSQLIYIISSYFKKVYYDTPRYKTDEPWLKCMIVFENYHNNSNNNILDDILNQVNKDKIIKNIIDVKYDNKYIKFIKKLIHIFDINKSKLFKLFTKYYSIIKYISQNKIDEMYIKRCMITLDKCIRLCDDNKIKVAPENITKSYNYKIKIASNILQTAEIIYFDILKKTNTDYQEYLTTIGEYYILKIYTKLRKIKEIKQKFNINTYITNYIEKITNYAISIEFAKTFELFSMFNLIHNNSKKINIFHLHNTYDENCTNAIKYYFTQTNNKTKINSKIYLDTDKLSDIISKNIDYCYFDCNKKNPMCLLSYIITSLKILKLGCNCVFKTHISRINFQISYLNLLALFFEHIYITKSNLDTFVNDEIYIIAKNKRKHIDKKTYNNILDNIISNNIKFDIEPNNIIYKSLIVVINAHINNMNMILYYYDNREVLDMHLLNIEQQKYDFIREWININKMSI
jgi:hypothetical protein